MIDVGLLVSHLYGAVRVMVAQRHHLTSVGALHPSGALPVIYAMPTVHGVDLTGRGVNQDYAYRTYNHLPSYSEFSYINTCRMANS